MCILSWSKFCRLCAGGRHKRSSERFQVGVARVLVVPYKIISIYSIIPTPTLNSRLIQPAPSSPQLKAWAN